MDEVRQEIFARLAALKDVFRSRFGVKRLRVFGSVVRGDFEEDSDVDILVVFEGGATFDKFMDLKLFLEDQLGRRVDLVTEKALKPRLRVQIEQEAVDVS